MAIKIYFDEEDNRRMLLLYNLYKTRGIVLNIIFAGPAPHDTTCIKNKILEHFQIKDR